MANKRFWGLTAIFIGTVALIDKLEAFPYLAYLIETYWPLALIVIGVLVLLNVPRSLIVLLAVVFLSAVVGLDLHWSTGSCSHFFRGTTEDVQALEAHLVLGAGEIKARGFTEGLYEADVTGVGFRAPIKTYSIRDGVARLEISQGERYLANPKSHWNLRFSELVPLRLKVTGGAGKLDFDFSDVPLERLELKAGAGQISVQLGGRLPHSSLSFSTAAADIRVKLPKEARVQLIAVSPLLAKDLDRQSEWSNQDGLLVYTGSQNGPFFEITVNSSAARLNVDFT
ncbi:MAG: hypothetical protein H0Z38_00465 [Firmicutes bacterium]|nr:hypothetical protein [Bacillota bacterium]